MWNRLFAISFWDMRIVGTNLYLFALLGKRMKAIEAVGVIWLSHKGTRHFLPSKTFLQDIYANLDFSFRKIVYNFILWSVELIRIADRSCHVEWIALQWMRSFYISDTNMTARIWHLNLYLSTIRLYTKLIVPFPVSFRYVQKKNWMFTGTQQFSASTTKISQYCQILSYCYSQFSHWKLKSKYRIKCCL